MILIKKWWLQVNQNMHSRFNLLYHLILIVFLFSIINQVIVLQNDDTFVLPEMAWFGGMNLEFLNHLLAFNQFRFTWIGDFQLFRPGLFLLYFIYLKIFYTFGYFVLKLALVFTSYISFVIFEKFCTSYIPKWLAVLALLAIFSEANGYTLLIWPHINSYLIAITLFISSLLIRRSANVRSFSLAIFLMISATFFHEFVVLSLVISLLLQSVSVAFRKIKYNSRFVDRNNLIFLGVPILIYFLVRYLVMANVNEISLGDFELNIVLRLAANLAVFSEVLLSLVNNFFDSRGTSIILGGFLFTAVILNIVNSVTSDNTEGLLVGTSLLALCTLLSIRVLDRGTISPWYTDMIAFLGLFNLLILLKNSQYYNVYFKLATKGLALLLIVSVLFNQLLSFKPLSPHWDSIGIKQDSLAEYYTEGYCFGGVEKTIDLGLKMEAVDIFTGKNLNDQSELVGNKLTTLLNLPKSCQFSSSEIPLYLDSKLEVFFDTKDGLIPKLEPKEIYSDPKSDLMIPSLGGISIQQHKVQKKLVIDIADNYYFSDADGVVEFQLVSHDEFPQMNNVSLFWHNDNLNKDIVFTMNNNDLLLSTIYNGESKLINVDVLHKVTMSYDIKFILEDDFCHLFVSEQKVISLQACGLKNSILRFSGHDNNTPSEKFSLLKGGDKK